MYVTLRKGTEYDAYKGGFITLWYAYNEYGCAVTWGTRKADVAKEARSMGYKVAK